MRGIATSRIEDTIDCNDLSIVQAKDDQETPQKMTNLRFQNPIDSNEDDHPFTGGDENSPNRQIAGFMGSEGGKSQRISNDGGIQGGSDYRNAN